MAVFLKNDCSYVSCDKTFSSLSDLIIHIEQDHIDFDPAAMLKMEEEKPDWVPLSYIQRFSHSDAPRPMPLNPPISEPIIAPIDIPVIQNFSPMSCILPPPPYCPSYSHFSEITEPRHQTPLPKIEQSKLKEEFSPDLLTQMNHKLFEVEKNHKKPYACNMPGCQKRYKNWSGIRYHYKKYHNYVVSTSLAKKSKGNKSSHATSLVSYSGSVMHQNANSNDFSDLPMVQQYGGETSNDMHAPYGGRVDEVFQHNSHQRSDCLYGNNYAFVQHQTATDYSNNYNSNNAIQVPQMSFKNHYSRMGNGGDYFSGRNDNNNNDQVSYHEMKY